jgi:hypothetical protein
MGLEVTCGSPRTTLERLKAIEWSDEDAMFRHAPSRAALMREYLRRSACWAQVYDAGDFWPFFDIAERVDATIRADADVLGELEDYLSDNVGRPSIGKTCRGAVHWAALRSETTAELPDLDDPYEPLLLMYERGGGFTIESEFIDLTGTMVLFRNMRDYLSREPVTRLDARTLEFLDAPDAPAS